MKYTEHQLQKDVVKLFRLNGILVFQTDVMIALRFLKSQKERILFIKDENALGYFKGQSDLVAVLKNKVVFIEMKLGNKGKQSLEQKHFENLIKERGFEYIIIRTIDDAINFIEKEKNSI